MEGLGVIVHVVNFLGSYILLFLFAYPVSWKTFLSPICQQYFIDLSLTSLISSSVENYIKCFGMLLFVLKWQNTCMVEKFCQSLISVTGFTQTPSPKKRLFNKCLKYVLSKLIQIRIWHFCHVIHCSLWKNADITDKYLNYYDGK